MRKVIRLSFTTILSAVFLIICAQSKDNDSVIKSTRASGDKEDNIKANLVNLPKVEKEIVVLENDYEEGAITGSEIDIEALRSPILKDKRILTDIIRKFNLVK